MTAEPDRNGNPGGYADTDSAILPLDATAWLRDLAANDACCRERYTGEPVRDAEGNVMAWSIADHDYDPPLSYIDPIPDEERARECVRRLNSGDRLLKRHRVRPRGDDGPLRVVRRASADSPAPITYSEPADPMPWLPGDVVTLGPEAEPVGVVPETPAPESRSPTPCEACQRLAESARVRPVFMLAVAVAGALLGFVVGVGVGAGL